MVLSDWQLRTWSSGTLYKVPPRLRSHAYSVLCSYVVAYTALALERAQRQLYVHGYEFLQSSLKQITAFSTLQGIWMRKLMCKFLPCFIDRAQVLDQVRLVHTFNVCYLRTSYIVIWHHYFYRYEKSYSTSALFNDAHAHLCLAIYASAV